MAKSRLSCLLVGGSSVGAVAAAALGSVSVCPAVGCLRAQSIHVIRAQSRHVMPAAAAAAAAAAEIGAAPRARLCSVPALPRLPFCPSTAPRMFLNNSSRFLTACRRDEEIRRTIRVLCRRTKNNPVLIGACAARRLPCAAAVAAASHPWLVSGCSGRHTYASTSSHLHIFTQSQAYAHVPTPCPPLQASRAWARPQLWRAWLSAS